MFKESEEQKAAKEAEWKAQQEIINRRRNPEAMAAYEAEVNARRAAAAEKVSDTSILPSSITHERHSRCPHPAAHLRFSLSQDAELKELQKGNVDGDAMEEWQRLRNEGKLSAFEKDREAGERSLGGEGLMPDRLDEEMPFIDSGYVDDSQPDIMEELSKGFGKLFGGDKK